MIERLRYVTNEQGERVGVLLDLEEFRRLTKSPTQDAELLVGLNQAELEALAQSMLAPTTQSRLDQLLAQNAEAQLSPEQSAELDSLLAQVDQLNILKTRARYSLHQLDTKTTGT